VADAIAEIDIAVVLTDTVREMGMKKKNSTETQQLGTLQCLD